MMFWIQPNERGNVLLASQRQGFRMKVLAQKPQLLKVWPAHALLIFANPIVSYVKSTNQITGNMTIVHFLNKVGGAKQ